MIDKIIYMYVFRLFRKTKYPDRRAFCAVWLPKLVCLFAVMGRFTDKNGYVVCQTLTDKVILWTVMLLVFLDGLYIFYFSSTRNHGRTEKEVERALRQSPKKWKALITLYLVAIIIFVYIVCCVI